MTDTMNQQDDNTKHEYNRYILEVLQLEWEQADQRTRLTTWVREKLEEALMDYDREHEQHEHEEHEQPEREQVQHACAEHTPANASYMVADVGVAHDHDDVNDDLDHDEWLDEV